MRKRGFEKVKKYKDFDFNLPKRATKNSAGYDFESPLDVEIGPKEVKLVSTGIKSYMQEDEVLELYNRSSNGRKGLKMANSVGIIDGDYYNNPDNEGEISFLFENTTDSVFKINKGDRIGQGIFKKFLTIDNEEEIKGVRTGGFGSTGKKGITLIALAVTIIVLIILIVTTTYLTVYNIEQSKKNLYMSEMQIVQTAVIDVINTAKNEGKEISEVYKLVPIKDNELEAYENYLSSPTGRFYLITSTELKRMNVQNLKDDQQFLVNWETAEILNLNVVEYKGVIIKASPIME